MRNVFCNVAGLNSSAETVLSGGDMTSKSLLGFDGSVIVNTPPVALVYKPIHNEIIMSDDKFIHIISIDLP